MLLIFFFSSRRRHTRLQGDWSSDVCSSDLLLAPSRRHFGGHRKLSNRVARVHRDSFLGPPPVFLLTIATAVRTGQCRWCEKASPIWLPAFRMARGGMLQYRPALYPTGAAVYVK